MAARCVVALGANLGDRLAVLRHAVRDLEASPGITVTAASPVVETRSVGGPEGSPDYFNAVVELRCELAPLELLEVCQRIEQRHGRTRELRWGPRTLDLDVVCVEGVRSEDPRLVLPHPRAAQRAFVLRPWELMDPAAELDGVPVARLARAAADLGDLTVTEHRLRPEEETSCAT
ncbi:2-amino-4-hydroxy-6-hydroxymethyldihydropteridine diphosphokinase [Kocuria rhizophila]|uniref:2-amino-4-hydroxy-6- hydroxymethyldihydropteridine diphosphokinase n=1 Tax=Kocuria rhizophila TaxID=72000 RepID=UPI0011A03B07|nr:2-amino-4-hydroxy-6-hydroxymethyldihydropteridine diphosphokinase [Kocuria rhizophila]